MPPAHPAAKARCRVAATSALLLGLCSAASAQSATLLRLRNPASSDRLVVDSAGGLVMLGINNGGSLPTAVSGPRMMWYPAKTAFRAATGAGESNAVIGYASA